MKLARERATMEAELARLEEEDRAEMNEALQASEQETVAAVQVWAFFC